VVALAVSVLVPLASSVPVPVDVPVSVPVRVAVVSDSAAVVAVPPELVSVVVRAGDPVPAVPAVVDGAFAASFVFPSPSRHPALAPTSPTAAARRTARRSCFTPLLISEQLLSC
jgi:hypothetical protein